MSGKKYYWLKLKRDFFKRHDIRILECMPDGSEIVLLYLKMLCESLDHDGALRFSEEVPYDADMLSAVMGMNTEMIKRALKAFLKLGLIEMDGDTIIMTNEKVMVGSETEWAEKKRRYKEQKRTKGGLLEDFERTFSSTTRTFSDKSIENREKSIENREKSIENREKSISIGEGSKADALPPPPKTKSKFCKPSIEEVRRYCEERQNGVDAQRFFDYYESNGWKVGKNPMKDWKASVRTWERRETDMPKKKEQLPYLENTYSDEDLNNMVRNPLEDLKDILGG